MTETPVLLLHAAATLFMTGVIWFVQLVHYPLFRGVGEAGFVKYAEEHSRRTTWVVAPAMLIELATGAWLVTEPNLPPGSAWAGLGLLGVVWLSTFLLQVPRHQAFARGWAAPAHRFLVLSNWVRTVAWSLRGALALWWLWLT